jgi:glutathione S-transferase
MIELYHAGVSTCSQKVRLVLAEKGLDFKAHDVDLVGGGQHDAEYAKLNPNHVVPTLIDDGNVLIESTLINEYLDDAYPEVAMRPADAAGKHALRLWTKKLDTLHPQCGVITFAIGPRTLLLNQPAEVREANINAIPDPAQRERRRSVVEHGVKAPEFAGALLAHLTFLDEMQTALEGRKWLSGGKFGLADAAALPFILRLDHLAMTPLLAARPKVSDWLSRVQSRPSYQIAVTDWLAEPIVALFRRNGEAVWADVEQIVSAG